MRIRQMRISQIRSNYIKNRIDNPNCHLYNELSYIRERDDEKKYFCLQADRELPVGERRKKDNGKYISEQQTKMWDIPRRYLQSRLCRRHRYLPGYCWIPAKPQGVSHAGIKVVTRVKLVLRDKGGFFISLKAKSNY